MTIIETETKITKPKRKPGRPPGQRYKDWKVKVRFTNDLVANVEPFWEAIEALAEFAPCLPELVEKPVEPEEEENLNIWAS
jgi:hypothetical protein